MQIDIDKIKPYPVYIVTVTLWALIAPGYLILYLFKPQLFEETDIFKLTILAISMTGPVLFGNVFLILGTAFKKSRSYTQLHWASGRSILISSLFLLPIFYLPILVGYCLRYSIRSVINLILICEVLAIMFLFGLHWLTGKPDGVGPDGDGGNKPGVKTIQNP